MASKRFDYLVLARNPPVQPNALPNERLLVRYPLEMKTVDSTESPDFSEVAAKYLPSLVDLFRQRPEALGSVTTLINVISTTYV